MYRTRIESYPVGSMEFSDLESVKTGGNLRRQLADVGFLACISPFHYDKISPDEFAGIGSPAFGLREIFVATEIFGERVTFLKMALTTEVSVCGERRKCL